MIRQGVILLCMLCTVLSAGAQNPLGFSLLKKNNEVELSFQNESNLIVVPIILNGNGPYNFILDTGSESGIIFDKWVIADHNMVNARTIPIYASDGVKITDLLVANDLSVQLKGVSGKQQSMLVFQEESPIDIKNTLGVEAMGVLGSEIFNRFVVKVDYQKQTIRLYEPEKFTKPRGFKKVPIEVRDLRPFVKVTLKQKGQKPVDVNLLIDTGASSALFLDEENNPEIVLPENNIKHIVGSGLTGEIKGRVGRVNKVRIGKRFKFRKVVASYPENWNIRKQIDGTNGNFVRYGTIGSDMLSKFIVIYDYMHNCMYIKKADGYKDAFRFNTLGLRITAIGEDLDQYFINEIIPNSPAEKNGLLKGDEIIALDGKPVFFYKFSEINNILRESPGKRTVIIIRRDGQLIKKSIKHKKLI